MGRQELRNEIIEAIIWAEASQRLIMGPSRINVASGTGEIFNLPTLPDLGLGRGMDFRMPDFTPIVVADLIEREVEQEIAVEAIRAPVGEIPLAIVPDSYWSWARNAYLFAIEHLGLNR